MKKTLPPIIGLILWLSACSSPAPAVVTRVVTVDVPPTTVVPTNTALPTVAMIIPTMAPTPTIAILDYGPMNFPVEVSPLTGLPVSDPSRLERRPVSIKVQIFPRFERPPMGLSSADIVYDYYQNNGMTRFNAIFLSNDVQTVGPVRSARLFDAALIRMYKSILAFAGADVKVAKKLFGSDFYDRLVVEGSTTCPAMCRQDPNGTNILVANTKEIGTYVAGKGVSNTRQILDGMTFKHEAPANGQSGLSISARFSISAYTRWDYDPTSGRYLRFQDTQEDMGQGEGYAPLVDGLTQQQITADNVVVILVKHGYFQKSTNSEIIEIDMGTGGEAFAFRNGQMYEVLWSRPALDSVLTLTYQDGSPFPYKPGTTWYEAVGESSEITTPSTGAWRFVLKFP